MVLPREAAWVWLEGLWKGCQKSVMEKITEALEKAVLRVVRSCRSAWTISSTPRERRVWAAGEEGVRDRPRMR